jgi:hypothetical protein
MKQKNMIHVCALTAVMSFLAAQAFSQDTKVTYFGHTGYTAKYDDNPSTKDQSAFNTGGFNMFVTSELSEKITVLGEFFMGFKGDGATLVDFNIERLYVKYAANDKFNIRVGRMYTPLGFWNNRYTQGLIFQPTINRPYAVRNQNDKGIIATNSVGLQLDGENIGKLRFSYYVMVDNTSGAPSINTDNTTRKSITAKLKVEPIENWELFTSARTDFIAAGSRSVQGLPVANDVNQTILNVGLAHMTQSSPFELAFEYFRVNNDVAIAGQTSSNLMYGYVGYRIGKITPYLQADVLTYPDNEIYFTPNDLTGLVIGSRYALTPSAVIKLEYKYRGNEVVYHEDVLSVQVAARF